MTAQMMMEASGLAKTDDVRVFRVGPRMVLGTVFGLILIVGIGGWAVTAKLAGAVISTGVMIVDQNVKSVQHRDGGIVSEIAVREGDVVTEGQILFRLDDAQTEAELSIVHSQIVELSARKARLIAERDGSTEVSFPRADSASSAAIINGEERLFAGQLANRESQKQQLELGIVQIEDEVVGLQSQRLAKLDEIDLVAVEYAKIKDLIDRQLTESSRLYTVDREQVRLRGELGEITASIARAQSRSGEIRLQILSIDATARTEAQRELGLVEARLAELGERSAAIQDRLSRTDIRAPIAGTVNELNIHTLGGVISPAEVLVTLVPIDSKLKVEIRLAPVNIDRVSVDLPARLRFPSFNQRTTPELNGTVSYVSPATTRDPNTGEHYYLGYVEIPAAEVARLDGEDLLPGMPVEVYVQTDERTVFSYLAKPVMDQFNRAFRER